MAGEYRTPEVLAKLPAEWADRIRSGELRLALPTQPVIGATIRKDLNEALAAEYEAIGVHDYARKLRAGDCFVILVPQSGGGDRVWRPGELFMTS